MALFGNSQGRRNDEEEEPIGIAEFFNKKKAMPEYLVTVEPNSVSGQAIRTDRLTGKTEEFVKGYVEALKSEYDDYNKYRVHYHEIK